MDLIKAYRKYLDDIINRASGMKILLMDEFTLSTVSMIHSKTYLYNHEIYLMESLANKDRPKLPFMKCICLLTPQIDSISLLESELNDPRYSEYYIYLINSVKEQIIVRLAGADKYGVVKDVLEVFMDYYPIYNNVFSFGVTHCSNPGSNRWNYETLSKCTQSMIALLLSLKIRPIIKYDSESDMAEVFASELAHNIKISNDLFDFYQSDPSPTLLILDRYMDITSPLLIPWTYRSMIHETFELKANLIKIDHIKSADTMINLCPDIDKFYDLTLYKTMGELGDSIKAYAEKSKIVDLSRLETNSINEIHNIIEQLPQQRELTNNVTTHIMLISELNRLIEKYNLYPLSEIEQLLACDELTNNLDEIYAIFSDTNINDFFKVKLLILSFAMKLDINPLLEKWNTAQSNANLLMLKDISVTIVSHLNKIRSVSYASHSLLSAIANTVVKPQENAYTKYTPPVVKLCDQFFRDKLKKRRFLSPTESSGAPQRPGDLILFFINGVTYDEVYSILANLDILSKSTPTHHGDSSSRRQIIIGGTTIHNSMRFIEELCYYSNAGSIQNILFNTPGDIMSINTLKN